MKYDVTITETLKMTVEIEADSREEAEQIASDNWKNSEYVLDADNFSKVSYEAADKNIDLTYRQMVTLFRAAENENSHLCGYVVFSSDSFDKPYSERSRTYGISSNNKAFQSRMGGYSIYGSSLDGSDMCVRLDQYIEPEYGGKDGWKIERCYMSPEEFDRAQKFRKDKEHER